MRWKARTERTKPSIAAPVALAAMIVSLPVLLPVISLGFLVSKLSRVTQEWGPWFAWWPVSLDRWSEDVGKRGGRAWLETVDRRARPYDWPTEYRAR